MNFTNSPLSHVARLTMEAAGASPAIPADAASETRPWGTFHVLEEGAGYKVKRLMVEPGHRLSLQRHRFRAEHWVVIAGSPRVVIGGRVRRLKPTDAVTVPRGAWHRIENPAKVPVIIIEIQRGSYLGEDDIFRRQDDYGRSGGRRAGTRRRLALTPHGAPSAAEPWLDGGTMRATMCRGRESRWHGG